MHFITEQEPAETTLTFREQADGRKLSRLPGGKIVLVDSLAIGTVQDGDSWRVRLDHRETFAVAHPLEKVKGFTNTVAKVPSAASGKAMAPPAAAVQELPPPAVRMEPKRILRAEDRVALFVDGANMDGAARLAGYFVDYKKLRDYLVNGATFYAAYYYVADLTTSDPQQQRYLDFLSYAGYIVRKKPVKVIQDAETGERTIKCNLDTEIVLDMVNTAPNYDVAFLLSGDSDFERAVDLLRSQGKRIYLVTSRKTCSRELSFVADKPIFFIEDLRSELARENRTTER